MYNILYTSSNVYNIYVCGCSYVCITSAELDAMYYMGGPRLPLIQAAELGLSFTQADGMVIIAWIR